MASIGEMKADIRAAGLSSRDCVEIEHLRARWREARARLAEADVLVGAARGSAAAASTSKRGGDVDLKGLHAERVHGARPASCASL